MHTKYGVPFLRSDEVRQTFIEFYAQKHHSVVKSSPLVLPEDPSTLFVNSGMMPFKSIFLGSNPQKLKRVCNTQRVLRVSGKHNDLDEVGLDDYHHTFFEMLGHWSFGDYFKKETIILGWKLMTEIYRFPKNRLFVTIHHTDEEAYTLWREETDVEPHRILRFDKDNFWEMGSTGPCGTCSEIHFDRGDIRSQKDTYNHPTRGVNGTDHRYIELINFVFIAFDKQPDGSLKPLQEKHIDTGAGLERLCAVIQGEASNYETDLFQPLTHHVGKLLGKDYSTGKAGIPHRVISDHIRAVSFALADGVHFASEGRGYVIRRILRRALRFGHTIGLRKPCLYALVDTLVDIMAPTFSELAERQDFVKTAIQNEEEQFLKTLSIGLNKLEEIIAENQASKTLAGSHAFTLYDTYGFPLDLTAQIARENGLKVDEDGYHKAMQEQKERAKKSQMFTDAHSGNEKWTVFSDEKNTTFCGYASLELANAQTIAIRKDSKNPNTYFCILKDTPFYPTSGGQKGDKGWLENEHVHFEVTSTDYHTGQIVHTCILKKGQPSQTFEECTTFRAKVHQRSRTRSTQHHSTTHLLHAALKQHLGEQVSQRGAYYDEHILRFDFSFPRALSAKEIQTIEDDLNTTIRLALPVTTEVMSYQKAKDSGAITFAGESYGEEVRVLTMQETNKPTWVSKELCGGTHVHNTGAIGVMVILSESAVAAGIRRITAKAGDAAYDYFKLQQKELTEIYQSFSVPFSLKAYMDILKTSQTTPPKESLPGLAYAQSLQATLASQNTTIKELQEKELHTLSQDILSFAKSTPHSHQIITKDLTHFKLSEDLLTQLAWSIGSKNTSSSMIVCLWAYSQKDKTSLQILITVSQSLQPTWHAGKLVSFLCKKWGGRGGGRADRAKGGIKECSLTEAQISEAINDHLQEATPPYN